MCARRSRPVQGAGAGAGCRVFPVFPFPPRVSRTVCHGASRPGVPYPRSLVRHSMRSVRSAGSVLLPFWYFPPVLCVCVCVPALSRRLLPPPLPWLLWRAHPAQSRCWSLVGRFHAVRAPPRVLPRSRAPSGLLGGGGRPGPVSLLPGLRLCAPRGVGLRVWGVPAPGAGPGGGGGLRAVPPDGVAGGASGAGGRLASVRPSAFPGQATKRVSLASLWPWRAWPPHRSGSCLLAVPGRGLLAPLCAGAGLLVHRGSSRSRRLGAWRRALLRPPSRTPRSCRRGGGDLPLCLGGSGGRASLWPGGRWGLVGGVGADAHLGSLLPSSGGAACGPPPSPSFVAGASPPGVRIRLRSWGSPGRQVRPGAGGSAWRGGGGVAVGPSGAGGRSASVRPSAFPGRATKLAQGPGEPVVSIRICDAEHRPPL